MHFNSDIKRIVQHRRELKKFFECPHHRCVAVENLSPSTMHAFMSLVRFTKNVLHTHHKKHHKKLMEEHGHTIHHLLGSKNTEDNRQRLMDVAKVDQETELKGGSLLGGSFFSSIGHFFHHAANSVGNAFKKAGETIYHKAIQPAVKGIETVGKDIYKGVKDVGEWIVKNRKFIADVVDKAIGILSVLPIPEVQEVAQILKPYADQTNKIIQGTGFQFLTNYPRDNLVRDVHF